MFACVSLQCMCDAFKRCRCFEFCVHCIENVSYLSMSFCCVLQSVFLRNLCSFLCAYLFGVFCSVRIVFSMRIVRTRLNYVTTSVDAVCCVFVFFVFWWDFIFFRMNFLPAGVRLSLRTVGLYTVTQDFATPDLAPLLSTCRASLKN